MPYNNRISGNITKISGSINPKSSSVSGNIKTGVIEDYDVLKNKPSINNVILSGNKTSEELNLQPAGDYATRSELNLHIQDKNYTFKQLSNNLFQYSLSHLTTVLGLSKKSIYLKYWQYVVNYSLHAVTSLIGSLIVLFSAFLRYKLASRLYM